MEYPATEACKGRDQCVWLHGAAVRERPCRGCPRPLHSCAAPCPHLSSLPLPVPRALVGVEELHGGIQPAGSSAHCDKQVQRIHAFDPVWMIVESGSRLITGEAGCGCQHSCICLVFSGLQFLAGFQGELLGSGIDSLGGLMVSAIDCMLF